MSKLRILVPIKRVLDYAIRPRIKADKSGIDLSALLRGKQADSSRSKNVHESVL